MKSRIHAPGLAIGITAIVLFVYLMAGLALRQSRQHYEHQAVLTTQNLARTLAVNVSGVLDKAGVGLFAVATEAERQLAGGGIDGRRLNRFLDGQREQIRDFEGMWVADGEGVARWGTQVAADRLVSIADREYFRRLQGPRAPGMVISKPVIGRVTKAWSLAIARRINRADGSFAGVALGSLRVVDYFSDMFARIDVGRQGRIALRDEDLALITRFPGTMAESGQPGSRVISAKAREMVQAHPVSASYTTVAAQDGVERTYSYQKVAGHPIYVFVSLARADYLAPWRKEAAVVLAMVLLFTILIALFTRITYRNRAKQELAQEKAVLESIFNGLPEAVVFSDIDQRVISINRSFTAILGYTLEELKGKEHSVCYETRADYERQLHLRFNPTATGLAAPDEVQFRRKDGAIVAGEISGALIRSGSGVPLGYIGVIRDISERRRAEEALRQSEMHFQEALDHQPVPISICMGDQILHCNQAFVKTFGYTPEDLPTVERWMDQAYPDPAYRKETEQEWRRELQLASELDRNTPPREYEVTCKDGSRKKVIISGRRIGAQFIVTFIDVSQLRKSEENRQALETQLNHLHRMESVGRLAGGISHDMNNVLAAIMSVSELLKHRGGAQTQQVDLILEATRRGRNLLKGLMAFARKEVEDAEFFDLNELVWKEAELLSSTMLQRIKLDLDLAPRLPRIMGSATALSTALMNLCVNAMDAMPEGGRLLLRTAFPDDKTVELVIQDTGMGMPPEVISRAMEPFYTTKPAGKGTGLGLSMVFGTVQAHGGSIDIQSQVGQGTEVRITLPVLPGEGHRPVLKASSPWGGGAETRRVLLVDDDSLVRETAASLLESQGYRMTVASGGYEALGLLEHGSGWDVVVLDLNMPDLDGLETLRRLRRLKPDLPVLLTTGYADELIRARLEALGPLSILAKPYSIEEFEQALGLYF